MNVLRPALARRGQIAAFSGRSFRAGLADHHSSNASRSREEPESFNAGEAHRLTFAPRVFVLEVVRVDCEHPAAPRATAVTAWWRGSGPTSPCRSARRRGLPRSPCRTSLAHAVARFTELAARARVYLEVLAEQPGARREGSTSFNHALFNRAFKHWTWQGLISIKRGGTRDEKRKR